MTRCDLACGHTAFALDSEERQTARGWRWCYAHSRFVAIVKAESLEPAGTRSTARLRRHALRKS